MMRADNRGFDALRTVSVEPGASLHAEGSCLVTFGHTRVLCTASVEKSVPRWMRDTGLGWVSAEYGMLPRATHERNRREAAAGQLQGRTVEIQRLVGRSLRICLDRATLGCRAIKIDCDVLQADGGTRCAAITGGFVALRLAIDHLLGIGTLARDPMIDQVAAVSCGIRDSVTLLDLDYKEDSSTDTDANFVLTRAGKLVELQATAERRPFDDEQYARMLALARGGCQRLVELQDEAVAAWRARE